MKQNCKARGCLAVSLKVRSGMRIASVCWHTFEAPGYPFVKGPNPGKFQHTGNLSVE